MKKSLFSEEEECYIYKQGQGHVSEKSGSLQLKHYRSEIAGTKSEYLLWNNSEFFLHFVFDL